MGVACLACVKRDYEMCGKLLYQYILKNNPHSVKIFLSIVTSQQKTIICSIGRLVTILEKHAAL